MHSSHTCDVHLARFLFLALILLQQWKRRVSQSQSGATKMLNYSHFWFGLVAGAVGRGLAVE